MGNFAYYVALYGGFNYVSKEFEEDTDVPHSYYLVDDNPSESQREYLDDIRRVTRGGWAIVLIVAGSVHPESFHFVTAIQPKLNAGATTIEIPKSAHAVSAVPAARSSSPKTYAISV